MQELLCGAAKGLDNGIEESKENKKDKIKDLEEKRSYILEKLGYSEQELVKAKEEAEIVHTHRL